MSIHEHHSIVILCDDCNEAAERDDFPTQAIALRWMRRNGWVITPDGKHVCEWCKTTPGVADAVEPSPPLDPKLFGPARVFVNKMDALRAKGRKDG